MGTHPNLPSTSNGKKLADILKEDQGLTGSKVVKTFPDSEQGSLPFLFKVLSIGTALSVQAHPDKKLAERLHKERGDVYKGEWVCPGLVYGGKLAGRAGGRGGG